MSGIAYLVTAMKSHPVAITAGVLILALVARGVGRVALYAFMVALVVGVGAVWVEEFLR